MDEVYERVLDPQYPDRTVINTIRLLRSARLKYTFGALPEQDWLEFARSAARALQSGRGAIRTTDVYEGQGEDKRQVESRFQVDGVLWTTTYLYDPKGMPTGSHTAITADGKSLGSFDAALVPARRFRDIPRSDGRPGPLFNPSLNTLAHVQDDTYVIQSHIVTSWGTNYDEYRRVGDARIFFFQQGLDWRLNTQFDGPDPIHALILDPATGQVMADSDSQKTVKADEFFTPQRVSAICEYTGMTLEQFWAHLEKLGVNADTEIPLATITPRLMHGSLKGGITYGEKHANSRVLAILPTDPPRGRVLAEVTIQGDFVMNFWWKEAEGPTGNFGILPESLTWTPGKYFKHAVYSGRETISGVSDLKDLQGRPSGQADVIERLQALSVSNDVQALISQVQEAKSSQEIKQILERARQAVAGKPGSKEFEDGLRHISEATDWIVNLEGLEVLKYKLASTDPLDSKLAMWFTLDGRLVAELYEHEVIQVMKHFVGMPAAKVGQEQILYNTGVPFRHPLTSILTGLPERPGRPSTAHGLDVTDIHDMIFQPEGGKQKIDLESDDREGMDLNITRPHDSTYVDGRSADRYRSDLPKSWFTDFHMQYLLLSFFGFIFGVYVAGLIAEWIGRVRRSRRPPETPSRFRPLTTEDQAILTSVDAMPNFGFQPEVIDLAKEKLKFHLTSNLTQGESLQGIIDDYLDYYRIWRARVRLRPVRSGELRLEDLFLLFVLQTDASNFDSTPSFLNYLLYEMRRDPQRRDGHWVDEQFSQFHHVLELNIGSRPGNIPGRPVPKEKFPDASQERFLSHEDIEALFRSRMFLFDYDADIKMQDRGHGFIIGRMISHPKEYKTFLEVGGGWGGWRGWLRTWHIHYRISVLNILGLVALEGHSGLFPNLQSLAIGLLVTSAGFGIFWLILNNWLSPKNKYAADSLRPEEGFSRARVSPALKLFRWGYWSAVVAAKIHWDYPLFGHLRQETWMLLDSHWAFAHGNFLLVALIHSLIVLFYFLDTFAFFYIAQGVVGYVYGKFLGIGRIKKWSDLVDEFDGARQQFYLKMLPPALRHDRSPGADHRRQIAWARYWNRILYRLYNEDYLTEREWKRYRYQLADEREDVNPDDDVNSIPDFLEGTILASPNLAIKPGNRVAEKRLLSSMEQLFMSFEPAPAWDDIQKLAIMTPLVKEDVIYTLGDSNYEEDLNRPLPDTGWTPLTYHISRVPDEWENFVRRMQRDFPDLAGGPDIAAMANLPSRPGQPLIIGDARLRMQVRLWASYRFQSMARTVRGQMYYQDALYCIARLNFPDLSVRSKQDIKTMIRGKFQYIIGAQNWGKIGAYDTPAERPKKEAIVYLMEQYPLIQLASFEPPSSRATSSLWEYDEAAGDVVRVPEVPIVVPGNLLLGQGKGTNQANILRYIVADIVQNIDMNQDGYLEQAFKKVNMMQRFRRNRRLVILGFPERIYTAVFSKIGGYGAYMDRVFNTLVQRVNTLLGARDNYGHPDMWRVSWIQRRLGISSKTKLNDDIFSAFVTHVQGGEIEYTEAIEEGKGREGSWGLIEKFIAKLGMGAGQQGTSRELYWVQNSPHVGFDATMARFYGGVGFYQRDPLVRLGQLLYGVVLLLLGLSAYVSIPSESWGGLQLIFLSQAISFGGIAQMALHVGWILSFAIFFSKMLTGMMAFFQAHLHTQGYWYVKGLKGDDNYAGGTGRGHDLGHKTSSDNMHAYAKSHLYFSIVTLFIDAYGMLLWQSWSVFWSWPFITTTLSGLLVAFLMNPGATPLNAGIDNWWRLLKRDWLLTREQYGDKVRWERLLIPLAVVLAVSNFQLVSLGAAVLIGLPFLFFLGVRAMTQTFIMVFVTLFGTVTAPLGIRSTRKAYIKGILIGLAGGAMMWLPVWHFGGFTRYLGVVLSTLLIQLLINRFRHPGPVPPVWDEPPSSPAEQTLESLGQGVGAGLVGVERLRIYTALFERLTQGSRALKNRSASLWGSLKEIVRRGSSGSKGGGTAAALVFLALEPRDALMLIGISVVLGLSWHMFRSGPALAGAKPLSSSA